MRNFDLFDPKDWRDWALVLFGGITFTITLNVYLDIFVFNKPWYYRLTIEQQQNQQKQEIQEQWQRNQEKINKMWD